MEGGAKNTIIVIAVCAVVFLVVAVFFGGIFFFRMGVRESMAHVAVSSGTVTATVSSAVYPEGQLLRIDVNEEGAYRVNDKPAGEEGEVLARIVEFAEASRGSGIPPVVIVTAQEGAEVDRVTAVLNECEKAGISDVTLHKTE